MYPAVRRPGSGDRRQSDEFAAAIGVIDLVTVLDHPDNETNDRSRPTTEPIPPGSLGLSQSGTSAYWIVNGQARSAHIY